MNIHIGGNGPPMRLGPMHSLNAIGPDAITALENRVPFILHHG
ncbi:hypothetical protein [Novipirellula rosea]